MRQWKGFIRRKSALGPFVKMSWKYLDDVLLKLSKNSTLLGKYWVATLLLLRLIVLTVFGENVWSDEQREFTCNTKQPGCENVCFNNFAPVSNVRMWGLQILSVSVPGALYFVYVMHVVSKKKTSVDGGTADEKCSTRAKEDSTVNHRGKVSRDAHARWKLLTGHVIPPDVRRSRARLIWRFYLMQIFVRVVLECVFVMLQFTSYLYRWTVPEVFHCSEWPCPHTVDCFVSRPREKTVFFRYMYAVSGFSILLSLAELLHIAWIGARRSCAVDRCQDNAVDQSSSVSVCQSEKWKSKNEVPNIFVTSCSDETASDAAVASSSSYPPSDYVDMRPSNFHTYL